MANILLVEDDYLDVMSVQRSFKKANIHHDLHIARNGREALQMLRGEGNTPKLDPLPSVILLDINMPKMNGLEFLKEMRSDPELRNINVFIMTTSGEEQDRTAASRLGITGYIIKPLSFEDFVNPTSSMDSFNLLCDLLKA